MVWGATKKAETSGFHRLLEGEGGGMQGGAGGTEKGGWVKTGKARLNKIDINGGDFGTAIRGPEQFGGSTTSQVERGVDEKSWGTKADWGGKGELDNWVRREREGGEGRKSRRRGLRAPCQLDWKGHHAVGGSRLKGNPGVAAPRAVIEPATEERRGRMWFTVALKVQNRGFSNKIKKGGERGVCDPGHETGQAGNGGKGLQRHVPSISQKIRGKKTWDCSKTSSSIWDGQ